MSIEDINITPTQFKVGDSVTLKTGEGPLMIIDSFEIDKKSITINWNKAICKWQKKKKEYTATFDTADLMLDGPFFIYPAVDSEV